MSQVALDVKDRGLAAKGVLRIEWAEREMPVLRQIRERFAKERPLEGIRIGACLHVTTETANLMRTLQAGGADVVLCASNPLSTQDDVAAALVVEYGIPTYAIKGEDRDTYYAHMQSVIDARPQITMDDGADVVGLLHSDRADAAGGVIGGTEETTTGVIRLRVPGGRRPAEVPHRGRQRGAHQAPLRQPLRHRSVDPGRHHPRHQRADRRPGVRRGRVRLVRTRASPCGPRGTGPTWSCSRSIRCGRSRRSWTASGSCRWPTPPRIGDIFVTATGDMHVLRREHFEVMKDGAIVANTGHFDVEIDIPALRDYATSTRTVRDFVEEFVLPDGRRVFLLAEGRLVNLSAAEGHPASVMDMSFANQALCAEYMVRDGRIARGARSTTCPRKSTRTSPG